MKVKELTIHGLKFCIHEKSIQVEGVAKYFYFTRPVGIEEAKHLADLITVGRKQVQKELRELIGLKNKEGPSHANRNNFQFPTTNEHPTKPNL